MKSTVRNSSVYAGMIGLVVLVICLAPSASAKSIEPLYFTFQSGSEWPASPSSLLVQSPSYIDVPTGAILSVHLMQGDTVISTSRLTFQQSYFNDRLVPPVPVASFLPTGSSSGSGQPLPGASLVAGEADLGKVAANPGQYRLMWALSNGIVATPGRAIVTGSPVAIIDLKFSAVSASATVGDQKPGSVLFFNRYTSSASSPAFEDTVVNLTNTNAVSAVSIRLFMVNSATCETVNFGLCLAPRQTISFQISDLDPGVKGYLMAIATNSQGEPIQFNWLIGNGVIRQPSSNPGRPLSFALKALAIAKRQPDPLENVGGIAEMVFNDVEYDRLPSQIAFDHIPSQANAQNATVLSIYRPTSDLRGGAASAGVLLSGWGVDLQNQVLATSASISVSCYSDFAVNALRMNPITIGQLLPPGATAWLAASANDSWPLMGAQFNSGEFSGGVNARPLTLSESYTILVPISPVACPL